MLVFGPPDAQHIFPCANQDNEHNARNHTSPMTLVSGPPDAQHNFPCANQANEQNARNLTNLNDVVYLSKAAFWTRKALVDISDTQRRPQWICEGGVVRFKDGFLWVASAGVQK